METWNNLKQLSKECYQIALKHGFWEEPYSRDERIASLKAQKIALMHSELSEALEAIRKPSLDAKCPGYTSEEIEMADIIIRILEYCYGHQLRIEEAINAKMEYNKTRPYKHGKTI